VALSRCGTVWWYTDNRYAPPTPYVATNPFEPYAIAAVELADEKLAIPGRRQRWAAVALLRGERRRRRDRSLVPGISLAVGA
jgi:uncharacterized OB-fold protein